MRSKFNKALKDLDWKEILSPDSNDPNISMNNLHLHVNKVLDLFAPLKKPSKKELKLKSKPWINHEILSRFSVKL